MKIHKLEIESNGLEFLSISSIAPIYKIAHKLNQKLNFSFFRYNDIKLGEKIGSERFVYINKEYDVITDWLLSNFDSNLMPIVPKLKSDYIFISENKSSADFQLIINDLKGMPEIQSVLKLTNNSNEIYTLIQKTIDIHDTKKDENNSNYRAEF
jgi:hypothetical protein